MVSLSIPDDLYSQLEQRARESGKTPTDHARQLLERALADEIADAQLLAEIRRDRDAMAAKGIHLTDDMLREAKNWGRE
jgi:hypothetical protein